MSKTKSIPSWAFDSGYHPYRSLQKLASKRKPPSHPIVKQSPNPSRITKEDVITEILNEIDNSGSTVVLGVYLHPDDFHNIMADAERYGVAVGFTPINQMNTLRMAHPYGQVEIKVSFSVQKGKILVVTDDRSAWGTFGKQK